MLNGKLSAKGNLAGGLSLPEARAEDYERLKNLPSIENVELRGNKSFEELGLKECSNQDILNLFK